METERNELETLHCWVSVGISFAECNNSHEAHPLPVGYRSGQYFTRADPHYYDDLFIVIRWAEQISLFKDSYLVRTDA